MTTLEVTNRFFTTNNYDDEPRETKMGDSNMINDTYNTTSEINEKTTTMSTEMKSTWTA